MSDDVLHILVVAFSYNAVVIAKVRHDNIIWRLLNLCSI